VDNFVYHRALSITGIGTVVTLGKGTVITGKKTSGYWASDGGTGILVGGGAWLLMGEGSAVTGCEGYTNSVTVSGNQNDNTIHSVLVINKGADISNNNSSDNAGGVLIVCRSICIMTGGTIRNNTSSSTAGGVHIEDSTFTMYGGEISGNTSATKGGGVYNTSSGIFTMYNGKISGNTAGTDGGGVYNTSTFTMYGGVIYGNEATNGDLKNTAGNGAAALSGSGTKNGDPLSTTSSTITAP
jgi:hypothetical protein